MVAVVRKLPLDSGALRGQHWGWQRAGAGLDRGPGPGEVPSGWVALTAAVSSPPAAESAGCGVTPSPWGQWALQGAGSLGAAAASRRGLGSAWESEAATENRPQHTRGARAGQGQLLRDQGSVGRGHRQSVRGSWPGHRAPVPRGLTCEATEARADPRRWVQCHRSSVWWAGLDYTLKHKRYRYILPDLLAFNHYLKRLATCFILENFNQGLPKVQAWLVMDRAQGPSGNPHRSSRSWGQRLLCTHGSIQEIKY